MFYRNGSIIRQLILLRMLSSGGTPSQTLTVTGVSPLFLVNAVAHSMVSLTQYGKCEQNGGELYCNNGTLKFSPQMANVNADTALVGYYISTNGVVAEDPNNWFYQAYIPVKPSTKYTLSMDTELYYVTISEYSTADDGGFVRRNAGGTGGNTSLTITTRSNTRYIRFGANIKAAALTLDDVLAIKWMLNEGGTALPYEPYVEGGIYVDGTPEVLTVGKLPSGYTLVENVVNAAGTVAATNIKDDVDDTEYEIRVKPNNGSWYIFQSRATTSAYIYGISGSSSGQTITFVYGLPTGLTSGIGARNPDHIYLVRASHKNGVATLYVKDETTGEEDTQTTTYNTADFTPSTVNLRFWGNSQNTINAGNYVYHAKMWKSGDLVLDCVPVTYGGEAGLYDYASGSFIGASQGTLTAGAVVPTPTQTASVVNLFAVGDVKDEQDIISGVVTRRTEAVYENGAIVVKALAEPYTEQVEPQPLRTTAGTTIVNVSSEVSGIVLEAQYKAAA